jgi:hypothetical protein
LRKLNFLCGILLIALACGCGPRNVGDDAPRGQGAIWANFSGDASLSRRAPVSGPDTGGVDWTYYADIGASAPPYFDAAGNIKVPMQAALLTYDRAGNEVARGPYVSDATESALLHGRQYRTSAATLEARDANGAVLWSHDFANLGGPVGLNVLGGASDGTVVVEFRDFGSYHDAQYSIVTLSAAGAEVTRFSLDSSDTSSWAVHPDGFILRARSGLAALEFDGSQRWLVEPEGFGIGGGGPRIWVVPGGGINVIGFMHQSDSYGLLHVTADGTAGTPQALPDSTDPPHLIAQAADGTGYVELRRVGHHPTTIAAVAPEGTVRWDYELPGTLHSHALAHNGLAAVSYDPLSTQPDAPRFLTLLGPAGSALGQLELEQSGWVAFDGELVVIAGHSLQVFDLALAPLWQVRHSATQPDSIRCGAAGEIYLIGPGAVTCLTPAGAIAWRWWPNSPGSFARFINTAALLDNGMLVVAQYPTNPQGAPLLKLQALAADGREAWTYELPVTDGASLTADGDRLLVASSAGSLYCLAADGTLNWEYSHAGTGFGATAVTPTGNVYAVGSDKRIHALDANGNLRWRWGVAEHIRRIAAAGEDLYCASSGADDTATLRRLDAQGQEQWNHSFVGAVQETRIDALAVGADGGVCASVDLEGTDIVNPDLARAAATVNPYTFTLLRDTETSGIYAFTAEGTLRWNVALEVSYAGSEGSYIELLDAPTLDRDGRLYCTGPLDSLFAIDAEGHELWRYEPDSGSSIEPVLAADGKLLYMVDNLLQGFAP